MLQKLQYFLLVSIVLSLLVFNFLKPGLDILFFEKLSLIVNIVLSASAALICLAFVLKPVKKLIQERVLLEEKYLNMKNLYELYKKQLDEKDAMLRQRAETISTINRINKAMISTVDLNKILELILESAKKDLNFDRAILFLAGDELVPEKLIGFNSSVDLTKLNLSLVDKTNFIVKSIFDLRPKILGDINENDIPQNYKELYAGIKPELTALIPLISKDQPIGVLVMDNILSGRKIEENDIRSLAIFINQAGIAIENARLFEMEKDFSNELQRQVDIAKKDLESAQGQLIKSERLSALGEMAAVVAHEVRNPMASIRAGAQRIHRKIADADPIKKYTTYIIEEVDRLERVVKNILIFSREPELQLGIEDINKLLKDTLYFLDAEIKNINVNLIESLDKTIPNIKIDPALIRQVLLNILQNALIFLAEQERRELKIKTYKQDNMVLIEISDTGPGIPNDIIKKIFEPFFSTRPRGTGLGLAISQRIMESHKGKITVSSNPGQGAVFTLNFPVEN